MQGNVYWTNRLWVALIFNSAWQIEMWKGSLVSQLPQHVSMMQQSQRKRAVWDLKGQERVEWALDTPIPPPPPRCCFCNCAARKEQGTKFKVVSVYAWSFQSLTRAYLPILFQWWAGRHCIQCSCWYCHVSKNDCSIYWEDRHCNWARDWMACNW
jgi:hypothetical protein